ncbi:MAG TPA: hypothetical protein VHX88_15385 [Solirubrobacteraceae bacterium]|jgi:pyruvate/2-oxoglutarate dehydrogenase complex dihydrolipoamide acyltransferase (E2) component|nr:hypothetical protein [Solirubrobacteraceae bacterium]
MDIQMIDQQYQQLQDEFQEVAKEVQGLAGKLQAASQSGDQNAREWLLDLKQLALTVQGEQMQVNNLLQAIHGWAQVQNSQPPPAPAPAPAPPPQQVVYEQPVYQQQPAYQGGGGMFGGGGRGGGGGMFGGFLNSGFGRAMEMGAGIGLGEDVINSIF